MYRQWLLYFIVKIIFHPIIGNAQPPEMIYSFNFTNLSDWTTENVGNGISVQTAQDCESAIGNSGPCFLLEGAALISRIIPTTGYHTIRIIIDAVEYGLDDSEWCYLQYETNAPNSNINTNIVTKAGWKEHDFAINVLDTPKYNNKPSFKVKIGNSGTAHNDDCNFDNLRIYAIPYTFNPTSNPTNNPTNIPTYDPTTDPTLDPTIYPTYHPTTNPTYNPTNAPSIAPTIAPSIAPSNIPSIAPSNIPSIAPSNAPSISPSVAPTLTPTHPTYDPTYYPTSDPSIDPTIDPTTDPTFDPTIDPTTDPTIDPTSDPTLDPTNDPTSIPTPSPILIIRRYPTSSPTFMNTIQETFDTIDESANKKETNDGFGVIGILLGLAGGFFVFCILIIVYIGCKKCAATKEKHMATEMNISMPIQKITSVSTITGTKDDSPDDPGKTMVEMVDTGDVMNEMTTAGYIIPEIDTGTDTTQSNECDDDDTEEGIVNDDNDVIKGHVTAGGIGNVTVGGIGNDEFIIEDDDNQMVTDNGYGKRNITYNKDDDSDDDDVLIEVNSGHITAGGGDNVEIDDDDDVLIEVNATHITAGGNVDSDVEINVNNETENCSEENENIKQDIDNHDNEDMLLDEMETIQ